MRKIYKNGNIITIDDDNPNVEAMVVDEDEFIYVGTNEIAETYIDKDTQIVDLNKRTVIPGIIENHIHLTYMADNLLKVNCVAKTKEEILEEVGKLAETINENEWILGFGWNRQLWKDNSFPTKEELDLVAKDRYVCLDSSCGHMSWVNTKTLDLVGINKNSKQLPGGKIYLNKDGKPLGCLADNARFPVMNAIPAFSKERFGDAIMDLQTDLVKSGITYVCDPGITQEDIDIMKYLYEQNKLKIRYYGALLSKPFGSRPRSNEMNVSDTLKKYYKDGPIIGLYKDKLTVRAIKVFADGSMGAETAWMLEPYSDNEKCQGYPIFDNNELYEITRKACKNDFQVITHAIGDAAVNQVLNAYEKTLPVHKKKTRNRIEHFQIAKMDDIYRLNSTGTIPCMQPAAMNYIDMLETKLGEERIKRTSSWRTIINENNIIPFSSDAPVDDYNPFYGMYNVVARKTVEGYPNGGWHNEEGLSRIEALKGYTLWGAYSLLDENNVGSIQKGKKADFVVIDRDIITCDIEEIKDIKVVETVIAGETVYSTNI